MILLMVVMVGKEFDVIEQSTSEEDRACCCEACACDVCVSCPYLKDLCNLLSKLVPVSKRANQSTS